MFISMIAYFKCRTRVNITKVSLGRDLRGTRT